MNDASRPRERSALTGFAVNTLDRREDLRDKTDAVNALRHRSDTRIAVVAGETPILKRLDGEALSIWFTHGETQSLGDGLEEAFLGLAPDGAPRFGRLLDRAQAEVLRARPELVVSDLRSVALKRLVPEDEVGPLGQAKALLDWHARHRCCAQCGGPTQLGASGWKRECSACGAQHFPRTDPVVIMLVTRGETCLLARQARFAPGMYSCIAGFVEPGETFEDAVRRESWEEAGLRVGTVRYIASQPWPFPGSLMIGCIAEALNDEIVLDMTELEAGRWFTREEALAMLEGTHPEGFTSPQHLAIANTLLRAWAVEGERA
ncbi:MAG: NAD(+) diphosphatase [Bosea sp. (in: a-proteobacteria)]|uniref:NAD(+) diphosphatase n=1 Tax=Bosea sp. (in: a-proteobacteria) TaxID=1871050 RepID=UPI00273492AC|nr:NAD(+) diphosphatase [Bosea sp. (in: a-proteobacteria)]MDP3258750.1 NAD(+) diphosphatase [Bosea sp. (in: a-proteobacteria)]MDP3318608.1 NAD(+) diphosphatase [Bosea sp. (in: a-proteobacteria)]